MNAENKPNQPNYLKIIKGTSFIGPFSGCMLTEADIERLQKGYLESQNDINIQIKNEEKNLIASIWARYPLGFFSAVKEYLNNKMDQGKK